MASIKPNRRKDGSIVSYKVTVSMGRKSDGKQIIKTATFPYDPTKTEKQNEKARDEFVREFEDKCKSRRVLSDKIRLKDFSEIWFKNCVSERERITQRDYRNNLENIIIPYLGHYKLSEIRVNTVQEFLKDLQESGYDYGKRKGKYSKSTITKIKRILSSLFSYAVANELLPSNPVSLLNRQHSKVEPPKAVKCFDIQQAADFIAFIENPIQIIVPEHVRIRNRKPVLVPEFIQREMIVPLKHYAAFTLTIFSGIRKEELLGLKWKDIDFTKCTIEINKAVLYLTGEGYIEKTPKSKAGYRKINIPRDCIDSLKKLKIQQRKMILEQGTAWQGSRDIEECWCFTRENGEHMSPNYLTQELQSYIRCYNKLCKEESEKLPVITFHQLRHTHASIAIAQGLEPTAVAKRLGHSNASVTLGIYAHSFTERDKAASDAVESAIVSAKNRKNRKSI